MDMTSTLQQMGVLFILIAVGFIANKGRIMSAEANRWITKLVINIAMPCTILNSVVNCTVEASGFTALLFFLLCMATMLIGFLVSFFVPKLLRVPAADVGLYRFMLSFANVGFMGYPVCEAVFGPSSSFYVAIFNILFSILSFSVGLTIIAGDRGRFNIRLIINPAFVGGVITLIIFITRFQLPTVLCHAIGTLGKVTTPAAMLITGSTLAMIPIKQVVSDW
ncbi:MAG: AEC family transporter, partial [Oscillospiraceae bacterium]|nr:AEC family transporter [Oscillospiraceae bacterium]